MRPGGFDMFWIIGGEDVLRAIAVLSGSSTFRAIALRNTEHPEWNGFSFYDLIFPLFMFHRRRGHSVLVCLALREGRRLGPAPLADYSPRYPADFVGLVINGILRFDFTLHFDQVPADMAL